MSHFTTVRTRLIEPEPLLKALDDLGFGEVEVHETPQGLYGYQGDLRPEQAEIIIRRKWIGPASNDIGFRRGPTGTYEAIISEYDRDTYGESWLNQLTQRYAYHVARTRLEAQGFHIAAEEVQAGGQIHLVLRRTV